MKKNHIFYDCFPVGEGLRPTLQLGGEGGNGNGLRLMSKYIEFIVNWFLQLWKFIGQICILKIYHKSINKRLIFSYFFSDGLLLWYCGVFDGPGESQEPRHHAGQERLIRIQPDYIRFRTESFFLVSGSRSGTRREKYKKNENS